MGNIAMETESMDSEAALCPVAALDHSQTMCRPPSFLLLAASKLLDAIL